MEISVSGPRPAVQAATRAPLRWGRLLNRVVVVLTYAFMLCPLFFVVWLSFFKDAIVSLSADRLYRRLVR